MRHGLLRLALVVSVSTPFTAGGLEAQEFSFDDLFSNDRFYREHGILKAEGDVEFLADLWILPVASDSARALRGVSLSNSDLQFVRSEDGGWQADYEVLAVQLLILGTAALATAWTNHWIDADAQRRTMSELVERKLQMILDPIAEPRRRHSHRQVGGNRRENVPPVERPAYGL